MTDKQKDIQNTKSEQSTSTTHRLHDRPAERHSEHKIRAINQYNSHPALQTSRKTFRTQNQSNQPVQLTTYMTDKQKDIQNAKSEQSTSTTHKLHHRQAERHSEHKIRAINQYNSHPALQTSRKTFRTQHQNNQPVQLTAYMTDKQKDIQNTKS